MIVDRHDRHETTTARLLHTWRIRALLTQEELAARAGLSVRTVRRLEGVRSAARPRLTSIRLLAEALDLDVGERRMLAALSHGPGTDRTGTIDAAARGDLDAILFLPHVDAARPS